MIRRFKRGLATAGALLLVLGPPGAALADRAQPTPNVMATDPHGATLASSLRPDSRILLTVRGFAPAATVDVRLAGEADPPRTLPADGSGVLRLTYLVPANLADGDHVLTFNGSAPVGSAGGGNVTVTMPNIGLFPFTVDHRASHSVPHEPDTGPHGPLASTGLNVLGLVLLGAVLLITGGLLARRSSARR